MYLLLCIQIYQGELHNDMKFRLSLQITQYCNNAFTIPHLSTRSTTVTYLIKYSDIYEAYVEQLPSVITLNGRVLTYIAMFCRKWSL